MYYMTIFGYFLSWYKCVDVVYTVLNSWNRLFCFLFIQNTTHLEVKGQRWHQAATFKCSKCKIQETSPSLLIWAQSKAKKKNFPSLVFHSYSLSESVGGVFFLDQWHLIYHTCVIWMPFSWVKWTRCELKPLSGCQLVDLSVSFFKTPSARSARTKKKKRIKQKKKEPHSRTKRLLSGPQMTRLFIAALLDWRAVLNLTDFLPPCQTLCHCSCPLAETCPITPACVSAGRRRFLSWQPVIRHEGLIHLDERHNNMWRGPTAPVWQRWLIRLVEQCNNVV